MEKVVIIYGEAEHHNEDKINELLKQGWTVKSVTANPGHGDDRSFGTYLLVLQK